jgi:hypothetical protein
VAASGEVPLCGESQLNLAAVAAISQSENIREMLAVVAYHAGLSGKA